MRRTPGFSDSRATKYTGTEKRCSHTRGKTICGGKESRSTAESGVCETSSTEEQRGRDRETPRRGLAGDLRGWWAPGRHPLLPRPRTGSRGARVELETRGARGSEPGRVSSAWGRGRAAGRRPGRPEPSWLARAALTLSESRSGSAWHKRYRKDFGSRHSVCRVVRK